MDHPGLAALIAALWCGSASAVVVSGPCGGIKTGAFMGCGLSNATIWNPDLSYSAAVFDSCDPAMTLRSWAGSTTEVYASGTFNFEPLALAPDFILPSALTSIEMEAFVGISAKAMLIPRGISSITGNPFAGSSVEYIYGFPGTMAENLVNQYHSQF